MATASQSNNHVYLFRLQLLIIDGSTAVLRNIFNQKLQNVPLNVFLARERTSINRLRANKVITGTQFNQLYPSGGKQPNSADFDITLIICLLRNLKSLGLNANFQWNCPPMPNDPSVEADLYRLKEFRNEIAHISSTTGFQEHSFQKNWTELEDILLRLNSSARNPLPDLKQSIDDYKTQALDHDEEIKHQLEITQWEEREKEWDTQMQQLKEDVTEVKGDVTEVKGDVTEVKGDLTEVKGDVTKVKGDITEVKGNVTEVKRAVTEIKRDMTEVKGDVTEVKGDLTEVKGDVIEIKKDVQQLKANVQKPYQEETNEAEDPDNQKRNTVLDKARRYLEKFMIPDKIVDLAVTCGIFDQGETADFRKEKKYEALAKNIINAVKSKGMEGYTKFKKCLEETHQPLLAELLESYERGEEPTKYLLEDLREKRKRDDLQKGLIQVYKQLPELHTLDVPLNLRRKLSIQVLPLFEPRGKYEDSRQFESKAAQNLCSWAESLYFNSDKKNRVVLVNGPPDVVSDAFVSILKTWIDSVDDAYVLHESFDAVIHLKGIQTTLKGDLNFIMSSHLAEKLGISSEECSCILSSTGRYLVLLEDEHVCPSILSTADVGDHYSFMCSIGQDADSFEKIKGSQSFKIFNTYGSRQVNISLRDGYIMTREDANELEKWMNSLSEAHSSKFNKARHYVCFENIQTRNRIDSFTLAPEANIESLEFSNCSSSFAVTSQASNLMLRGKSVLAIEKSVLHCCMLDTLCLCFECDFTEDNTISMLNELITEKILSSVDNCKHLQNVELRNMSIGRQKNINCCLQRSTIEKVKGDTNIRTTRTSCSALLGSYLECFDLEKLDFDSELSEFTKTIILDSICHKFVKKNNGIIIEAFVCVDWQKQMPTESIVCFTSIEANLCIELPKQFAGFLVLYKHYESVSTESVVAESVTNDVHYDYIEHKTELSRIIRSNVDKLFKDHSNLEAVCASPVRSRKYGIDISAPCIVLYCRVKGMIPYSESEFPKELRDPSGDTTYFTDIREGFFVLGTNLTAGSRAWNKELAMGCSIGAQGGDCSATLGPFLNICGRNETCFLTVAHMLQSFGSDDSSHPKILQPADGDELFDANGPASDITVEDRLCGEVLVSNFSDKVDAAVVKIYPNRMPSRGNFVCLTKDALNFTGFKESSFPTFDRGDILDAKTVTVTNNATDRIIKFGKQTGLTKGTLDLTEMAVKVKDVMLSMHYNGRVLQKEMKQQLKVNSYASRPFFSLGDSGSAVFLVDKCNKLFCIGMAIGFLTDQSCIVTPIQQILETINTDQQQFELKTFEFQDMDS